MMTKQYLHKKITQLRKRIARLSFQRRSPKKQAQLHHRLQLCEKALHQLGGIAALTTIAASVLQAQDYCPLEGAASPFDNIIRDFGGSTPQFVDWNGDGHLDLISGEYYGRVLYYTNYGNNVFSPLVGQIFSTIDADSRSTPQLIDVDGDGDLDLISGNADGEIQYYIRFVMNSQSGAVDRFSQQLGTNNPFDGIDVGSRSTPQLTDVDGDGDLDLISGNADGKIQYYRNLGGDSFSQQTGTSNPFDGIDVGSNSNPQRIDFDGDGDLDLVIGNADGNIHYYENIGGNNFTHVTGTSSPFTSIDAGSNSSPQLIDYDGDGDLDLMVGAEDNRIKYYENDGSDSFIQLPGDTNTLEDINVADDYVIRSIPQVVDFDGDGDMDLISGEYFGRFLYYENDGSGNFTQRTGTSNPFTDIDVGYGSSPELIDFDGDGDLDLVSGERYGTIKYYENDGSDNFTQLTGTSNPFDGIDVSEYSTPQLIDFDRDGDLDLISGIGGIIEGNVNPKAGQTVYYENDGSDNFTELTGTANPLAEVAPTLGLIEGRPQLIDFDGDGDLDVINGGERTFSYHENDGSDNFTLLTGTANPFFDISIPLFPDTDRTKPYLADLDGDGDLDLISGATASLFFYFENKPICFPSTADGYVDCASDVFDDLDVDYFSSPQLIDLDGDGDLDLISGEGYGNFYYYENDGSGNFMQQIGTSNPFDGLDVGLYSEPQLVDMDGDGDLDLISGEYYGRFFYYENAGGNNFMQQIGISNPFNGLDVGYFSSPQLIDFDSDGDLDLISGELYGTLLYYQNDGSDHFMQQIGTSNPFDGLTIDRYSKPQLVDVDGDGDLDLISGGSGDSFSYYENDGSDHFIQQTGTANPFNGLDVSIGVILNGNSTPQLIDVDGDGDLDLISGNRSGDFLYFQNTNLTVSASVAACTSNEGEVELNITSSDTEGPYTISNAFVGSIGTTGQLGAMEVIMTDITEPGEYGFEISAEPFGCVVAADVIDIGQDCVVNNNTTDNMMYTGAQTIELCDKDTIWSTASVGLDVVLTYSAREAVILKAGFVATNGCTFTARIGECLNSITEEEIEQRSGEVSKKEVTLDQFVDETSMLSIFPIPARNVLYYNLEQVKNVEAIHLFDMMGRLVKTERDINGQIDISALPSGQYTLILEGNGQRVHRLVQKL